MTALKLQRIREGHIVGVQYNGENVLEVCDMYFGKGVHVNIGLDVYSRTIHHKNLTIEVGDWVVLDDTDRRFIPQRKFNHFYELAEAPPGYKLIDTATGKERR